MAKFTFLDGMQALYTSTAAREKFCLGWKCILRDSLPYNGESYSLATGVVYTELCQHGGCCEPGQEIMYFLLKLIAKGHVTSDIVPKYWKMLFPERGSKSVRFASESPPNCAGFRLTNIGKDQLHNVPVKGYHFNFYGQPYTDPCKHEQCKLLDKYTYALIRAYSGEFIPTEMGDGSVIFKLMTTGSWLMAQLDCLHKYGSLQYFYRNENLWPINIHKTKFDITDVMWIPGSLLLNNTAYAGIFDDKMDEIMSGLDNRELFGVHGVLKGEHETEQKSVDVIEYAHPSSLPPNLLNNNLVSHASKLNQPIIGPTLVSMNETNSSNPSNHQSKSQIGTKITFFDGAVPPRASPSHPFPPGPKLSSPPSPESNYPHAAFGIPQPHFITQPENPWNSQSFPGQFVSTIHVSCEPHPSSLSNQHTQHVICETASQKSTPASSSGDQLDVGKTSEKKDRSLVKVKAAARGEKMIFISRDLASWGDKDKLLKSSCSGCKLALNKMNTVSIRPEKDVVPLIRQVIDLYKTFLLDMEPIREILMDSCFKYEN